MKVIEREINNWSEFVDIVSKRPYKRFIYRGQYSSNWPLETSIRRRLKDFKIRKDFYLIREKSNLDIFKARGHQYLRHLPSAAESEEYKNTLEWLSIMQHFGAPTRLLDWTYSPYVAAFFALENMPESGCVFELNHHSLLQINRQDFGKNYEKHVFNDDFDYYFIFPFEPKIQNDRLIAQQGLFLVPNDITKDIEEIIEEYSGEKPNILYKYIFNMSIRNIQDAIKNLKKMNIDNLRLFPGIEGLCKSMTLQLLESKSILNS